MITIVGAGPAGSYLGYLLAKQGKKVQILEDHNTVGSPVQCTGIVTHSIEKFFKLKKEVIAKKLNKVVVVSKNNKISVNVDEIVMWRDKFDRFVANMARDAGAEILLNHQFLGFDGKQSLKVKDKKNVSRFKKKHRKTYVKKGVIYTKENRAYREPSYLLEALVKKFQ